jgi:hypothetical protein
MEVARCDASNALAIAIEKEPLLPLGHLSEQNVCAPHFLCYDCHSRGLPRASGRSLNRLTALAGGRVLLASGASVEYDWLVLALGSDSVFFGIEGVKEYCLPFCTYDDAMRVSILALGLCQACILHFRFACELVALAQCMLSSA